MATHAHFVEKCRRCQTILSQCRCSGPKTTRWVAGPKPDRHEAKARELCERRRTHQPGVDILQEDIVQALREAHAQGERSMRERAAEAADDDAGHPAAGDVIRALPIEEPEGE